MPLQDEIVIPFRLDTGEADRVLDRTRTRVAASAADMARSADRAQAGFSGMESSIRGFAKAEAQENRTIRILAAELSQLGVMGGRASQVISTLAFSLAGGFGLGAAINLVQLGVGLLTDRQKKAAEEAENLRKAGQKLREEWEAATKPLDEVIRRLERKGATEAELARQEALLPLLKREADLKTKLEEENEKVIKQLRVVGEIQAAAGVEETPIFGAKWSAGVDAAAEALRQVQLQIEAVELVAKRAKGMELFSAVGEDAKRSREMRTAAVHAELDEQLSAEAEAASARGARMLREEEEERQHTARMAAMRSQVEHDELDAAVQAEAEYVSFREGARLAREKALQEELRRETQIRNLAASAYRNFAQSVGASYGQALRSSAAYERAMKAQGKAIQDSSLLSAAAIAAFAQDAVAGIAQEAMVEALWNLGKGFAALGLAALGHSGAGAAAAAHFTAAAKYGAIAAIAGATAMAIGQHRGMTAAERASLPETGGGGEGTSGGGGSAGTAAPLPRAYDPLAGGGGGGGTVVVRETVIVIGDPFETPAETARRAARRLELARDLDMLRREG